MKNKFLMVTLLAISASSNAEEQMVWPELPTEGYISGRVATQDDVEAGRAIFSMNGSSPGPVEIEIPQYALWSDEDGSEHAVVVLQAEDAPNGMQIVGLKTADGAYLAATLAEVKLLGTEKPS